MTSGPWRHVTLGPWGRQVGVSGTRGVGRYGVTCVIDLSVNNWAPGQHCTWLLVWISFP
jgi:hypothetical protein